MATFTTRAGSLAAAQWNRFVSISPAALALSELAWLLSLLLPNGFNFVDLRVYTDGAARLAQHDVYDFTHVTGDGPLPFTYPPFAAIIFYPLHFLPFVAAALLWQLLSVAALYTMIHICFRLLRAPGATMASHRLVLAWTVIAMWTEPVRVTLNLGQVNVFLVLAALAAAASSKWWVSGPLIGVAAGVKLTPAIGGLYFLARRRWASAVLAAVTFGATVAISYAIAAGATRRYFTTLLGDATRIGPVSKVWNQSLRGALNRLTGHDVGTGGLWLAAVTLTVILALLAWRTLPSTDLLGTMLIVQMLGLMVSPISWSHHFVWLVPLVLWLAYGSARVRRGSRLIAGGWLALLAIGCSAPGSLEAAWGITSPLPMDAVYTTGVLATLCWLSWAAAAPAGSAAPRSETGQDGEVKVAGFGR